MDFDRALLLLNVIEKALGHPQLRPLVAAASDELNAMVEPAKEEPVESEPSQSSVPDVPLQSEDEVEAESDDPKPTTGRRL